MSDALNNARDELARALKEQLERVVSGAAEDLQRVATRIAENAIAAASIGRDDLVQECADQARALAEANRMRLAQSEWKVFEVVVAAALRALAIGASLAKTDTQSGSGGVA